MSGKRVPFEPIDTSRWQNLREKYARVARPEVPTPKPQPQGGFSSRRSNAADHLLLSPGGTATSKLTKTPTKRILSSPTVYTPSYSKAIGVVSPGSPVATQSNILTKKQMNRIKPKSRDQNRVMGTSAADVAVKIGLPAEFDYEWVHTHQKYGHYGKEAQRPDNLALQTKEFNSHQMNAEDVISVLTDLLGETKFNTTRVSYPGTHLVKEMRYDIKLLTDSSYTISISAADQYKPDIKAVHVHLLNIAQQMKKDMAISGDKTQESAAELVETYATEKYQSAQKRIEQKKRNGKENSRPAAASAAPDVSKKRKPPQRTPAASASLTSPAYGRPRFDPIEIGETAKTLSFTPEPKAPVADAARAALVFGAVPVTPVHKVAETPGKD